MSESAALFHKDANGFYRCRPFEQFEWLEHRFSTRQARNAADGIITLHQIHSNNVVNACGLKDREQEGDALISNETSTRIGVRTADCVPILLADPETHAVATVHAGWKGTASLIVQSTIVRLQEEFDVKPEDLRVAIGPAIGRCCYEVGPEVAGVFGEFTSIASPSIAGNGKVMLDLVAINRQQLSAAGVEPARVYDLGLCTFCRGDEFYSYRREPSDPGRMISSISRII